MKKRKEIELDFEIDFLTNSIKNTVSGDSFRTEVLRLTKADLKQVTGTAKTRLIEHYQKTPNAITPGGQLMIINKLAANILIDKYFKHG